MDYPEVLHYLYEQLPMFQRIGPSAFKKNLDNTLSLCEALGNPQHKFKSIHVGGTNGKGSSSHMLAACLQSAGYKTGLYTSPHLKEFTERIKIDGREISQDAVIGFVVQNKALIEQIKPSFFEMTVVMAFDYFAKEKVDFAIIEVGLGGRLDSTNVINPLVALITNISYDHQAFLGDRLSDIASEKAGIIKRNTPIVISQSQEEVEEVFINKAYEENAPIYFADKNCEVIRQELVNDKLVVDVTGGGLMREAKIKLGLCGGYQVKNLPGVLQTLEVIRKSGIPISNAAIEKGLSDVVELTGLKGRWQKIGSKPLIICDTAHNEDGMAEVIKQIKLQQYSELFIVFGTVKDKDVSKILKLLPKKAYYFFCEAKIPRALPAAELFDFAAAAGLTGEIILDVNDAISLAKTKASEEDLIFVGGSNFVVAEIDNL